MQSVADGGTISPGPNQTRIAAGPSYRLIAVSGGLDGPSGIMCGGLNNSGQLGLGTRDKDYVFHVVNSTGLEVVGIACGREHSMLLAKQQSSASAVNKRTTLLAFGNSMYGQLGHGRSKDSPGEMTYSVDGTMEDNNDGLVCELSPRPVQLPDPEDYVVHVECGLDHTVLLTHQGNLYSMGWGADGQLGLGPDSSSDRSVPTLIERLSWKTRGKEVGRVQQISSSTDFTLALLENKQLWIWGNAEYGQCMVNRKIDRILEPMHIPHPIPASETIASVAAGGTFALLLSESGKVYTCGFGALGLGPDKTQILMPEQITTLPRIRKIFASTDYAAALDDEGNLYTWGTCGRTGRLGHGEFGDLFEPKKITLPEAEKNGARAPVVHDVALGLDCAVALVDYGNE
ncbi:Williams-Beuren syndrome chromosome region 16 protein [Dissophora globulifera]|uniref:Williams-Beuren syndrome chromosome region 16 protein n=1 Tax=Dissophora globulifera TaxID=979702 RepID=A0A9P6RMC4_9FUNG|nr:Williams-Beuren syndrome chromosome region 16 protein [Dissophora globulifera]